MCSREVKPKSIVHQIGQIGSKITKPISRRRQRIRLQRKLEEFSRRSSHQSATQSVLSDTSSVLADSVSTASPCNYSNDSVQVSDDENSQGDYHTVDISGDSFSDIGEEESIVEEVLLFETIDQNELLQECFLSNEHSDVLFLVHFFNEETTISEAVEDVLSIRVLETRSKCECRRINSKGAPLLAAKLQIDPEQPTIVAFKNGKILTKVSDISSSECAEVNQWLTRTRILEITTANNGT